MKIGYLVNQYPKVSHSFIRREIFQLQKLGVDIQRYSIRKIEFDELKDEKDIKEYFQTNFLINTWLIQLFTASIRVFLKNPVNFLQIFFKATNFGRKSQRGILRHWAYLAEASLLKEKLSKARVTHVHAHFGTNSTAVAMFCKLLGGPPYSFTVHGPEEFDDFYGLALKEKIKHCRFVVAVSNFGRGQLMRWCSQDLWSKIKVVHCTVDAFSLQTSETTMTEAPRFICVGRLCAQKGQLLLLEALHILDKEGKDFELVLAGDGEMRGVVEQQVKECGLQRKVRITGWISGHQVKSEILASRVMVLPSFAEGLPVVIMEALALRRPVISTYVAGIPELVEHGKNGWLVPAGSVHDLAAVLREALDTTSEQLEQMGEAGAQAVRERHDATKETSKLLEFFKKEHL